MTSERGPKTIDMFEGEPDNLHVRPEYIAADTSSAPDRSNTPKSQSDGQTFGERLRNEITEKSDLKWWQG